MDIAELLSEFNVVLEYGCGRYNDRPIRLLEGQGVLQVGANDFDRWANSVDFEFDIRKKSGMRALKRWLNGGNNEQEG